MAKTRQHDAQDVAEVQENDGGLQYVIRRKRLTLVKSPPMLSSKTVPSERGDSGVAR
jgi:hypothetical protein